VTFVATKSERVFSWKCRDRILTFRERPLIMGILNVTPDSFSDGGRHADRESAITHGLRMLDEGADIIDVGGESTRPGAAEVGAEEETRRVIPVIEELSRKTGVVISVDTTKAAVARRAMEAGACIINDVSALTHDAGMLDVAAEYKAGVVLMHMRGSPRTMQDDPQYGDVVAEVGNYLRERVRELAREGLDRSALAIDPGIGFGKTVEHNISLLSGLDVLVGSGQPVVVGVSRKSFIGKITGSPVEGRLAGSLAALAFCVGKGAGVLRVHDVKASSDAVKVAVALRARQGD
jgi:dihydropteroate synthase